MILRRKFPRLKLITEETDSGRICNMICIGMVEERSVVGGSLIVRKGGRSRSDYVGISSDKASEILAHRKSKVS